MSKLKKTLENLADGTANVATNIGLNAASIVGIKEGLEYLGSQGVSDTGQAITTLLAGAGLYELNRSGLVKQVSKGINDAFKNSKKKISPYAQAVSIGGLLTFGGVNLAPEAKELAKDLFPSKENKIYKEMKRIENRKTDFSYGCDVSKEALGLIKKGIINNPEELVYLSRVVYFEGGFDKKAKNISDIDKGMEAIASVMYNRFKFDEMKTKKGEPRTFTKKGSDDVFDVAFRSGKNRFGGTTWQFSCIPDHSDYFYENEGQKGWDLYEGGKLNVAVGKMNKKRANLAYQALVDVLKGKVKDPTGGALFYQNYEASDKYNKNWKKRGLEKIKEINSHDFYVPSKNKNWRKGMSLNG